MNKKYLIKNARIVNEGRISEGDVLIHGQRIEKTGSSISDPNAEIIDANGNWLIPGVIDDQVHFREPGLTHKANIATESRAAVAGGVTSFMEMPNTVPQAVTQELLEEKYQIGKRTSLANFSFYMGATNTNIDEVLRTDPKNVCGVKIFMGSSTGDMLVDNETTLENIFSKCPMRIALHCEDENTIRANTAKAIEEYGEDIPFSQHPLIRSREACYLSSSKAVSLAKKHGTRIHVLHISTAEEPSLFEIGGDLRKKQITSEVCVHHLTFCDEDYETLGSLIKCNPAIKTAADREALWNALSEGRFDVIATDHAPHTFEEKSNKYLKAPSGLPLVQHSLNLMLEAVENRKITMEEMVFRMCHAPADLFHVQDRGFIREGYFADLVLVDPNLNFTVTKNNLLYKCGWSPLEGHTFNQSITHTFVSGHLAWSNGKINEGVNGMRLSFEP
ncbi:MAG: dihydroorotase [Bacteroidetes bacterium]|nr:dihydroorotase [Bacteroidota bacterium]